MSHTTPHPLAGATVIVAAGAQLHGHASTEPVEFRIEDWNDRVFGRSWMAMNGNPAALAYAVRSAGSLPLDDEVVYGKDAGGLGHLVHVSEIEDGQR